MHILVSLPVDEEVEEDLLLRNVRKGLGSVGGNCSSLPLLEMKSDSIDCLFDSEERILSLEALVQDIVRNHLHVYSEISRERLTDTFVLGKTFDHFLKTFQWSNSLYPLSMNMMDLLTLLEQEAGSYAALFNEKNKQYLDMKKKSEILRREIDSIYTVDVNALAYREDKVPVPNHFFQGYYLGVKEKLRDKDLLQLEEIEGLFVESRVPVAKGKDGEIYEIFGRSEGVSDIMEEIEKKGFWVRVPSCTEKEFRKRKEEEKEVLMHFEEVKSSVIEMVNGCIQRVFVLLVHIKYLALYIESLLRFGLPTTFRFFVVEIGSLSKCLSKWKRLTKTWKYSKRITETNKILLSGENERIYDFVYRVIYGFNVEGTNTKASS
ncbi:V-type H+-transporting ATPase subunit C [Nematocida sp. LUAm3]|nr:V-type H+-transporting ATPase subunit C [Nematocida sp. LUAm3]KAI5173542.1 V-type H+-transporting ATPase subunit C [Nematocida sp. LUAm2]KAI5176763.1 V-type H+-transporting ATPase subunit C [Nematocida sp. LUAm1]